MNSTINKKVKKIFLLFFIFSNSPILCFLGGQNMNGYNITKSPELINQEIIEYKNRSQSGFNSARLSDSSAKEASFEPGTTSFGAYGEAFAWSNAWKLLTSNKDYDTITEATIVFKANPKTQLRFGFDTDNGGTGVFGLYETDQYKKRPAVIEINITNEKASASFNRNIRGNGYNSSTGKASSWSRTAENIDNRLFLKDKPNPLESLDGYYWISFRSQKPNYTYQKTLTLQYGVGKTPGDNARFAGEKSIELDNPQEALTKYSFATATNEYLSISDISVTKAITIDEPGHSMYRLSNSNNLLFDKKNWRLPEENRGVIQFKTSGAEILVALNDDSTPETIGVNSGTNGPAYTIYLGNVGNSRSQIQTIKNGAIVKSPEVLGRLPVESTMPKVVDGYRISADEISIWVRFENGSISAGTGDIVGENQVISWEGPEPDKKITCFSLSSGGSGRFFSGIKVSKAVAIPGKTEYTAETANLYRWSDKWKLTTANRGATTFTTNGSDFSIGLSKTTANNQDLPEYIVSIGSGDNSKIVFKEKNGDVYNILKSIPYSVTNMIGNQQYWLQCDGKELSLGNGKVPGENIIAYFTIAKEASLEKVSFTTESQNKKVFKDIAFTDAKEIIIKKTTLTKSTWEWFKSWSTKLKDSFAITFTCKDNDIKIGFATDANTNDLQYILQLGAANNTRSWLHKKQSDNSWITAYEVEKGISTSENNESYWIQVLNGVFAFGSGTIIGQNIIGYYKDETPTTSLSYFSFSHSGKDGVVISQIATTETTNISAPVETKEEPAEEIPTPAEQTSPPEQAAPQETTTSETTETAESNTTDQASAQEQAQTQAQQLKEQEVAKKKELLRSTSSDSNTVDKLIKLHNFLLYKRINDKDPQNSLFSPDDHNFFMQKIQNITLQRPFLREASQSSATTEIYEVVTDTILMLEGEDKAKEISLSKKPLEILETKAINLLQDTIYAAKFDLAGLSKYRTELDTLYNETNVTQLSDRLAIYGNKVNAINEDSTINRAVLWEVINTLSGQNNNLIDTAFVLTDEQLIESFKINDGKTYSLHSLYTVLTNGSVKLEASDTQALEPFFKKMQVLNDQLNGTSKDIQELTKAISENAEDPVKTWLEKMNVIFNKLKASALKKDKDAVVSEIKKAAWCSIDLFDEAQKATLRNFVGQIQYNTTIFFEQSGEAYNINSIINAPEKTLAEKINYYNSLISSTDYSPLVFAAVLSAISSHKETSVTADLAEAITTKLITPLTPKAVSDQEKSTLGKITAKAEEFSKQAQGFGAKLLLLQAQSDRNEHYKILNDIIYKVESGEMALTTDQQEALFKQLQIAVAVASVNTSDAYNGNISSILGKAKDTYNVRINLASKEVDNIKEKLEEYKTHVSTKFAPKTYADLHSKLLPEMIGKIASATGEVTRYFNALKEQTLALSTLKLDSSDGASELKMLTDNIDNLISKGINNDDYQNIVSNAAKLIKDFTTKVANIVSSNQTATVATTASRIPAGMTPVSSSGIATARAR